MNQQRGTNHSPVQTKTKQRGTNHSPVQTKTQQRGTNHSPVQTKMQQTSQTRRKQTIINRTKNKLETSKEKRKHNSSPLCESKF